MNIEKYVLFPKPKVDGSVEKEDSTEIMQKTKASDYFELSQNTAINMKNED